MEHLKAADPKLGEEIEKRGFIKREVEEDIFLALVTSIINQQISNKAAFTVNNRLLGLVGEITPENILKTSLEDIQKCGMSMRKAEYIYGVAKAVNDGMIDLEQLHDLSNEKVIKELTSLKGIGEWTAEMLLIHALERPDILSYKDLGIRRGLMKLHQLEELPPAEFEIFRSKYSPYGTVASIYLWQISTIE